jgi:hypothetical protein
MKKHTRPTDRSMLIFAGGFALYLLLMFILFHKAFAPEFCKHCALGISFFTVLPLLGWIGYWKTLWFLTDKKIVK